MSNDTTIAEPDVANDADVDVTPEERQELEEMLEAGLHFGHKRSLWNPAMMPYVYTIRRNVFLIDLRKTQKALATALGVLEDAAAQKKSILIVGTQPAAKAATRAFAEELDLSYVTERWIGGTLTNFSTISQRTEHLRNLESKRASGELEKYTKKERLDFDQEITRLNQRMGGIKNMKKTPDLLVVMSVVDDDIAVREAHGIGIPVIGVVDTNADPRQAEYPIPANDDVASSVEYVLGRMREAIERGRNSIEKEKEAK